MASPLVSLTPEQQKELEEKVKKMSPEELLEFQKKQCVFCQIISGKIPSKKLYEDDHCIAILDINPAARGHLLILPKEHYAIMPQIPNKLMGQMFKVAKNLSKLLLKALRVDGTTLFVANGLVAGQKAQHFMLHLIPRTESDEILNVEEHLLDENKRSKAKIAIENKLNELLGIKKEVVDSGSEVDETAQSETEKTSKKLFKKPVLAVDKEEKEEEADEETEEDKTEKDRLEKDKTEEAEQSEEMENERKKQTPANLKVSKNNIFTPKKGKKFLKSSPNANKTKENKQSAPKPVKKATPNKVNPNQTKKTKEPLEEAPHYSDDSAQDEKDNVNLDDIANLFR